MSNITQRYLKNNSTAAAGGPAQSENTRLISALVRAGECLVEADGGVSGGGGVRRGSLPCWLRGHWSLPWLDIVKWGQTAGAGLSRNAAALSVLEEPETLAKKSKRLRGRHGGAPCAPCFSCLGFAAAGRFKAEVQIPNYYNCHDDSDLEHGSPLFFIASPAHLRKVPMDLYGPMMMPVQ